MLLALTSRVPGGRCLTSRSSASGLTTGTLNGSSCGTHAGSQARARRLRPPAAIEARSSTPDAEDLTGRPDEGVLATAMDLRQGGSAVRTACGLMAPAVWVAVWS
jgi:hypothetical protein